MQRKDGDDVMEIKTFDEKVKDLEKTINEALNVINEENISLPQEEKRLNDMLDNTYDIVKDEVVEIASTVAIIKESGFNVDAPPVSEWAKEKLNIAPNELGTFLDKTNNKEEAVQKILNIMEAPQDVVSEVVGNNKNLSKKLVKK